MIPLNFTHEKSFLSRLDLYIATIRQENFDIDHFGAVHYGGLAKAKGRVTPNQLKTGG